MKTKKLLSLLIAFAMILSIIPAATITADTVAPLSVELVARDTDWGTILRSTAVDINGNGTGSITLTNLGNRTFTGLAIRSVGTGGANASTWEVAGTSVAAPDAYANAEMTITSVELAGSATNVSLTDNADLGLIAGSWAGALEGRANVELWNAFHEPNNRIVHSLPGESGSGLPTVWAGGGTAPDWIHFEDPAVVFPSSTTSITVNFTVSGVVGGDGGGGNDFPEGTLPLEFMARAAASTTNADPIRRSTALAIEPEDGDYSMTVEFPTGRTNFLNIAIRSAGLTFDDHLAEVVDGAEPAPDTFKDATITITGVYVNGSTTPIAVENVTAVPLVVDDSDQFIDGYADVQLWNGWSDTGQRISKTGGFSTGFELWGGETLQHSSAITSIKVDFTVTIDGDVAPENHDIKWNLNHSEIPATSTSVADGAAVVPPEVVERTGYNFLGWFDNAAGTGTAVDFTDLVATESVEYFAKWEIKTYVVTFNPGEGTLVTPSEGTRSVEHGSAVGEFPEVTRAGFNLTGWTTDGTPVDANTIVTAAVTFTANWVDESVTLYPITWNYNYSGSPDSLVVDVAEYAEISLPSEPTREGFVFAGWFDNAEGAGTAVEFTGLVATEAKEYFAKWVAQYSVTWDLNYIGTPPAVETVINHGDNIAAPTPAPTRSGYEFLGWFVNAEGTGDAVVFPVLAVGDRTFYAKWEITTTQSDGLEVQLMARTAWESDPDGDGSTGAERLLKGETVNIEQNGPGTITITAPSSTLGGRAFTGIAIRSESSTPGASGNQWDNKGDAEEAHENYKDAVITIDSVTVTGATATIGLQNNEELELVSSWGTASTNPFLNYVDVQLWNTYHEPNNRIVAPGGGLDTAFTDGGTEQNGWVHNTAPGVVFPTGTATITVNFTVTGIVGGGNYQPPATCDVCDSTECENRACVPAGSLPVRLMARNATGSGTIFKGPAVMIKDDGAYSAEVTFPGTLQQFVNFALRAPGTSWGDDGDEKGTAVTAPAAFGDATISVTKITANAGLNNLGLEDVLNLPLVATDNDLAGYADVQFWNAWGEPKAVTGVTTEDVWGGTGLNIPASTNKITIEFTISLDGAGTCDDGTCGNAICPTCFCQSHTWAANAVCGTVCAHAKCDVALTDCQQSGCEICFDPDACPTCNQLDCNGCVDVVLQTRPIWLSGGAFGTETGWGLYQDSDVLRIAKDDQDKTYTLTVDVKRRHEDCDDMCCILDMITDLKIAQKGTKMGGQDELINPGNANRDVDGPFREVGVTFNEIKVNDTVVDLIDHYMLPWFVARDDDAECLGDTCMTGVPNGCTPNDFWCPRDGHAGFVSAPVWNAWWKPHQLLQTGGDSPLALETRSGSNNANVLLANEEKLADDILSFTVTFTLCFDDERCEDCNGCLKENCDDCAGCTCEDFCGLCGCAQCFQGDTNDKHGIAFCADPLCSICYVCTSESGAKCRKFSCINCNPKQEFAALGSVRGEVDEDGNPVADIFDVLEILKFIVGMNSTITDGRTDSEGNVIITAAEARRVATLSDNANSQEEPEPNIFCVLEVLKYIVGMSSVIDGESIALPPSAAV